MARVVEARATTPDENKAILHRWCTEVFNRKQVEVVDELKVPIGILRRPAPEEVAANGS